MHHPRLHVRPGLPPVPSRPNTLRSRADTTEHIPPIARCHLIITFCYFVRIGTRRGQHGPRAFPAVRNRQDQASAAARTGANRAPGTLPRAAPGIRLSPRRDHSAPPPRPASPPPPLPPPPPPRPTPS